MSILFNQNRRYHSKVSGGTKMKFLCPVCLEINMPTDDVNHACFVAFGIAVCSEECHEEAYRFADPPQFELPFYSVSGQQEVRKPLVEFNDVIYAHICMKAR